MIDPARSLPDLSIYWYLSSWPAHHREAAPDPSIIYPFHRQPENQVTAPIIEMIQRKMKKAGRQKKTRRKRLAI
jgi:hypothetical protein